MLRFVQIYILFFFSAIICKDLFKLTSKNLQVYYCDAAPAKFEPFIVKRFDFLVA